jgi:CubicO group peptidase (beta-lactamase class C family)
MHLPRSGFPFISICITTALADFLGPTYPAPIDLTSTESLVSASWQNISSTLKEYLHGNQSTTSNSLSGIENITFSIGLFSANDPAAAESLQFHYTSAEAADAPTGVEEVDGDSIYRVASISKLFTVFAGLLELHNADWDRPLTDVLPELAEFARENSDEEEHIYTSQWEKITPWTLAAQIAGIARQGIPSIDLLYRYEAARVTGDQSAADPVTSGLPPISFSELGPCAESAELFCAGGAYLGSVQSQPPTFLPWTSPAYTNNGFILLGLALCNITGKSLDTIYREAIFEPLGMTLSNITAPPESLLSRSVIVGDPAVNFAFDGGITSPSGGIFSTTNDLAKFGVGILNSTLLPADQTRKWMKPISHTASLSYSVGAPWEIIRYTHKSTGRITDIYTKVGDSGAYGGYIVLIPDYNAGFSILGASTNETFRGAATNLVGDLVAEHVIPALEAQAAREADRNFAGTYISTDSDLNSSLTVFLNDSSPSPGLTISSWISNGTDMLAQFHNGRQPRLLPSIPNSGTGQVAFRASEFPQTSTYTAAGDNVGPFTGHYTTNLDWFVVDAAHYGGIGTSLFVFDVDGEGSAVAASPAVTRARLERRRE